ncbi:MAG TPA: hypothetical protein PKN96_05275 [Flavobacterium sp.]|uniref:hypothetical protein n=1 Tax=Flavobacterium sp. TaxID=239 RepID=UPI002B8B5E4D|nr:hypothetical protein [Flavobacterium sp.]HNP32683.1 hypothetical protein [Flavobacterium sp.]
MDVTFFNRIAKSNASTNCRNGIRDFVLENPDSVKDLAEIAFDLTIKNHYKAVWVIEMLAETHPELLIPYIDQICNAAPQYKHESAIRGISRTILFLTTSKKNSLTEEQKEKFIEISLDRLIGNFNIAPKAFAMYALAHYAKQHEWIKEELRNIINKDFANQSAGYKAAAREVLRKI